MSIVGNSITITTNSSSATVTLQKGNNYLLASGVFSGGTLTPEISLDNATTWAPIKLNQDSFVSNLTFLTSGCVMVKLPECKLRWTMSGAGTPSVVVQVANEPLMA